MSFAKDPKAIGICYGIFCWMGDRRFLNLVNGKHVLNEVALDKHLKAISDAGANMFKSLPFDPWQNRAWGKEGQFSPYAFVNGNWDKSKFKVGENYFSIFAKVTDIGNKYNMSHVIAGVDNCSATDEWNPLAGFYDAANDKSTKLFLNKMIDVHYGKDVCWEFGNELSNPKAVAFVERIWFPIIELKKISWDRLFYGAQIGQHTPNKYNGPTPPAGKERYDDKPISIQDWIKAKIGDKYGDPAKLAVIKAVHSCGAPCDPVDKNRPFGMAVDLALAWWDKYPIKVIFSDDGVWNGDSKIDTEIEDGKLKARPSAETWYRMASYILKRKKGIMGDKGHYVSFEHLPMKGPESEQVKVIAAIKKAITNPDPNPGPLPPTPPKPPKPPDPGPVVNPPGPTKDQLTEFLNSIFNMIKNFLAGFGIK